MNKNLMFKIIMRHGFKTTDFVKMDGNYIHVIKDGVKYALYGEKKINLETGLIVPETNVPKELNTIDVEESTKSTTQTNTEIITNLEDGDINDDFDFDFIDESLEDDTTYIHKNITTPINNKTQEEAKADIQNMLSEYNEVSDLKIPIAEKILRSKEESDRIKKIKKPRGWHFRDEYIDIEGNIYHKGILQDKNI